MKKFLFVLFVFSMFNISIAQKRDQKFIIELSFAAEKISIENISVESNIYDNISEENLGSYSYQLKDISGNILHTAKFNPPEFIFYDSYDGQNLSGGKIKNDNFHFFLETPFISRAAEIAIYNNGSLKTSKNINEIKATNQIQSSLKSSSYYPHTKVLESGNIKNRINLVFLGDGYTNIREQFADSNFNGKFDGDDYVDLNQNGKFDASEPYTDKNSNYTYDKGENFIDINKDGIYNANEQAKYSSDVNEMAAYLFANSIFGQYKNHINVFRIDSIFSEQAGADHEYASSPLKRNTALGSYYDRTIERLLLCDYSIVNNIIRSSLPELSGRYIVIVLVNSPKYGGSGGSISVSYNGRDGYEVMVHELGHTLPGLADEYYYSGDPNYDTYSGSEPYAPNVTTKTKREEIKWNKWIKETTPIPTSPSSREVGLFEGGYYHVHGVYRPVDNCKMRSLNVPFCPVCNEAIIKTLYSRNHIIDSYYPDKDTLTITSFPISFGLDCITPKPNTLTYRWIVNGILTNITGSSATFTTLPIGKSFIRADVFDSTQYNRTDTLMFRRSKMWIVNNQSTVKISETENLPYQTYLFQNYPNPFNPSTSINYYIPFKTNVAIKIFDILGKEIEMIENSTKDKGFHTINWNAGKFASGIYFYKLSTPYFTQIRKMVLSK